MQKHINALINQVIINGACLTQICHGYRLVSFWSHTCNMYAVMISRTAQDKGHAYEEVLTFTQVFNQLIDLCYSFFSQRCTKNHSFFWKASKSTVILMVPFVCTTLFIPLKALFHLLDPCYPFQPSPGIAATCYTIYSSREPHYRRTRKL